jgi:hypothetical protein
VDGSVNQSGNLITGGTNKITKTTSFSNPGYGFSLDSASSVASSVSKGAGTK